MVTFPTATRKSAFIAGFSLILFIALLESLESIGVLPIGSSEKQLFLLVILFFFVSALLFVIDVKSLAPNELKTKIFRCYISPLTVLASISYSAFGAECLSGF